MNLSNSYGTPMAVAILVIASILLLFGVGIAFQGKVHF